MPAFLVILAKLRDAVEFGRVKLRKAILVNVSLVNRA